MRSKAFVNSIRIAIVNFLALIELYASVCSLKSWSRVDLLDLNPAWASLRRWLVSRCQSILFVMIRSMTLHRHAVRAIGLYEFTSWALVFGFFIGIMIECFHSGMSLPVDLISL